MQIIVLGILIVGALLRIDIMTSLNILTNADSFAYLQMSHYFVNFSSEGFGTGWFGFLYSFCISLLDFFLGNGFFAAQIINILLFVTSGILLFYIAERYLHIYYNYILLTIFILSSPLLYYQVNILSENLYIPLFLGLVLTLISYFEKEELYKLAIAGGLVGLMYITRAEGFIYIAPILFIVTVIHIMRRKELGEFLGGTILLFFGFFILAFPYMVHLHTITGEWGLTNKGSSNIRQAMMRGVEEMDDAGFERAVGELTDDKKSLKSGFVGGLKYEKSTGEYSLKTLIMDDPQKFFNTWKQNVGKLVVEILPKMIIGDFIKTYQDPNFKFKKYTVIYYLLFIPLFFTFYGFALMYIDKRRFIIFVFVPLFLTASAFFTLFFVLERYFIPFLPLLLVFMVYGMQGLGRKLTSLQVLRALFFAMMTLCISLLGIHYFINNMSIEKYTVKKVAGERISEHMDTEFPGRTSLRIMERFPIVTYYSGNWERWIVPYANQADIITYAKYNNIDLLVVDSLDFARYRPTLSFLLDEKSILKNSAFEPIYVSQKFGEKVILYKIK